MKKKGVRSATQPSAMNGGYCTYACIDGEWCLYEDGSEEGFCCSDNMPGGCDEEWETISVDPYECNESQAISRNIALPPNSALYLYLPHKRVLHRQRGTWRPGSLLPHELSLAQLTKIDPKLGASVSSLIANPAFPTFSVIVSAPPTHEDRRISAKQGAKKKGMGHRQATSKKVAAKKAGKKSSTKKKK